jgi:hypothetical protein
MTCPSLFRRTYGAVALAAWVFSACGEVTLKTTGDRNPEGSADPSSPSCVPGTTRSCFLGEEALAGVGQCTRGTQSCLGLELGSWGSCVGSGTANEEVCDGNDNDCDGQTDEGLSCLGGSKSPIADVCAPYVGSCLGGTALTGGGTFTGTTCGQSDKFTPECSTVGTPEAVFHLPDLNAAGGSHGFTFTLTPGFIVSHVANDLSSCGDTVFAASNQTCYTSGVSIGVLWSCGAWFIVEKAGGGCGPFTLTANP